jgi:hypothetical protein
MRVALHRDAVRAVAALAATSALIGSIAAPAVAASPPRGVYGCTIGGGYAGDLHVIDSSHYRINNGRRGRYRASGHRINFVTGDWAGLFKSGRWYRARTTGGRMGVEIAMRDKAGYENTYCDRQ